MPANLRRFWGAYRVESFGHESCGFAAVVEEILRKAAVVHLRLNRPDRRKHLLRNGLSAEVFLAELRLIRLRERDKGIVLIHGAEPPVFRQTSLLWHQQVTAPSQPSGFPGTDFHDPGIQPLRALGEICLLHLLPVELIL